ncbi:MAG: hypothetical protein WC824_09715 [Bacteroidota bacterium]
MNDAEMILVYFRMLAKSPVTKAYLIEEIIKKSDEVLGPIQEPECDYDCICPCDPTATGCPGPHPPRALSPEARLEELRKDLTRVTCHIHQLENKYEMASCDKVLAAAGLELEDIWAKAETVPVVEDLSCELGPR